MDMSTSVGSVDDSGAATTDRVAEPRDFEPRTKSIDSPRVLMLITRNQRRGAECSAQMLAHEFLARGVDVVLYSLAGLRSEPELDIDSLGRSPLGLATLARVRRLMRNADVVVACGSKTLPAVAIAGLRLRCPIIYQNIGDPLFWANTRFRRVRVRASLRRITAVAALADQSASVLESRFAVPAHRITVIRNARSSTEFRQPRSEEANRARRALGLGEAQKVVVAVGALSPEKHIDDAIRAVARMKAPVHLVVVGEGPLRRELVDLAEQAAPGRVSFLGPRTDMRSVYWAADALVLTSVSEGVPGVLIEAGLCGLPVVSTDVGLVREVVVDGRTGRLVRVGDRDGLSDALEDVISNRTELGRNAREHCRERFDLDRVTDQWLRLLRSVHGGGRGVRS